MNKKIYDVFQTAADAYLEYRNNFLTRERFMEHFDLDEKEVKELFYAVQEMRELNIPWMCLDYYFMRRTNKKYSEKKIHW